MGKRKRISSGAKWEQVVGYSRAVRVGDDVYVSGTTSVDEQGCLVGEGDAAAQTRRIFEIIEAALVEAGSGLEDVVRTRIYVTDITRWEEIGRVHGEIFHAVRPASTMIEVQALVDPRMFVEIEVHARAD